MQLAWSVRHFERRERALALAWKILAVGFAAVLIGAGVLKYWALRRTAVGWTNPSQVLAIGECILGVAWLLAPSRAVLWLVTTAVFATFIVVNCFSIAHGESSCGCFGHVAIPPSATLTFDMLAVVFACVLGVRKYSEIPRIGTKLLLALSVGIVAGALLALNAPLATNWPTLVARSAPTDWIGRRLPIQRDLVPEVGDAVLTRAALLLYKPGCGVCEAARLRLIELEGEVNEQPNPPRILYVQVSSASVSEAAPQVDNFRLDGPLDSEIVTPTLVLVRGGLVQAVVDPREVSAEQLYDCAVQSVVPKRNIAGTGAR